MPTKKKRTAKRSPKQLSVNTTSSRRAPEDRIINILMPYILLVVTLFLVLCYFLAEGETGFLGQYLKKFLTGLFSVGAYVLPALLVIHAVFYRRDLQAGSHVYKFWFTFGDITFIGVLCALIKNADVTFSVEKNYASGQLLSGGGLIGGTVYSCLEKMIGNIGTAIVTVLFILVFTSFLFGKTPTELIRGVLSSIGRAFRCGAEERKERQALAREEREALRLAEAERRAAEKVDLKAATPVYAKKGFSLLSFGKKKCRVNLETGEAVTEDPREDVIPDEEVQIKLPLEDETLDPTYDPSLKIPLKDRRKREFYPIEEIETEPAPSLHEELQSIFGEVPEGEANIPADELAADLIATEQDLKIKIDGKHPADGNAVAAKKEPVETTAHFEPELPEYRFPPLSLLQAAPPVTERDNAEQATTARKLVETLASFGVKTTVIGIAKGPTITRYELQPQPGVRVRSIVNLADDIALALAASGVRIEAPIPGKEAVGIEVPNKMVETVYVRSLLDSDLFRSAKSKLNCCLGMDVAGKAIYCDLSKMPHLLIAGATGMGKSVCLNSLILSILYHASPEEVQMILIDPKKVEMAIYNRLPHLLVPVVSDPKKAAGALNWAVIEMEKRFIEMEEVGVRDIKTYNEITKNDPEKRRMSQIVILIDELADLMMTARDEVETSICRIAQKARAAGMHLVIGTQRPSVDVITGLIKANIPSRIAFTVASQVDSRTIIDIMGAEKLIGRGDMLYAPVGASKPLRVQGSFVSEKEIEAVCDFIRAEREAVYDERVSNLIEREASKCGEKKRGGLFSSAEEGDGNDSAPLFADKDPLLEKAIEVAITENKVATSLLQRKLSVGYARAAKLIDYMEEMNVVGPYAGSKPREVLWSAQYFAEYKMKAMDEQPID